MSKLGALKPERVFAYFEEICGIPRGSGNREGIAQYCMEFAQKHGLRAVRDEADNVVIFKPAAVGYEHAESVILQGHLDMVCQKDETCNLDFLRDGLQIEIHGDFVTAKGTTLGADNGIAVAMILAILENRQISHPAIEAVFTSDEEIGMCGAAALDTGILKSKKMINLDAEEDDTLTVSCAGGSDFTMTIPLSFQAVCGTKIQVSLKGLKGGHSGVEIHKGRINANLLAARFCNHVRQRCAFDLIRIDGGDKGNAIPNACTLCVCTDKPDCFFREAEHCLSLLQSELSEREPDFSYGINVLDQGEYNVIDRMIAFQLIDALLFVPDGVAQMSAEIEGLVESSQNLGILKTGDHEILLHFTLRSNKNSALRFLEERMEAFSRCIPCKAEAFGHYPPWEFRPDSELQSLYKACFTAQFGFAPKTEAIHAGLECGVFASKIDGLDCIAMGPALFDVHTVNERLSISSAEQTYRLLLQILENCR